MHINEAKSSETPLMVAAITRLKERLSTLNDAYNHIRSKVDKIDAKDQYAKVESGVPVAPVPIAKCLYDEITIINNDADDLHSKLFDIAIRLEKQLG
jgi:hypothetical protein